MLSSDAGNVRRIVSSADAQREPGDVLILTDDRPSPADTVVYRAPNPGDLGKFIAGLYGNPISAFDLLTTPWDMDGSSAIQRQEVLDAIRSVSQQWGNSTIDGAHGIANLLANAEYLLPAPRISKPLTDSPMVAVGAGPSTSAMLDDLRTCGLPIIACDAALGTLLKAGIRVDACTPLERLNSTWKKLPANCGDTVFAGSPFAPPEAITPFTTRTFWPTCDPIFDWYEAPDSDFHPGTTTGTCAVATALRLTNGPVYLVGHDLCGGHMEGATVSAELADEFDTQRMGYGGWLKPTKIAWLRAKYDLENMRTNRIINAAGYRGFGLRLDNIRCDELPQQPSVILEWPTDMHPSRLIAFQLKAAHLQSDLQSAALMAQSSSTLAECGLEHLAPPRNLDAIAYVLRPLYAQCSVMRRLGKTETNVVRIFRQAIENIVHTVSEALHG